ncbi:unnamed protein product [Arctia plantaginis]|uniref:EF-hand domain-containing protein n=1 Tax=Arctia plantaginis TaxID=874455 RepID=A0A8S1AXB2_ARCPL|nr:unnamed protein product [Arctia plantaginis]
MVVCATDGTDVMRTITTVEKQEMAQFWQRDEWPTVTLTTGSKYQSIRFTDQHKISSKLVHRFRRSITDMQEECEESVLAGVPVRHRPEPPGALAQVTRFSAHEIKLMYRGFKQECPSGVVDEEAFKNIFSQFFPLGDATQYAHYVFKTIKHKQSGKVNFEVRTEATNTPCDALCEFLDILSRVARGSVQEKLSWVFTLYDVDGDGRISRSEMLAVVEAIYELLGRAAVPPVHSTAAKDHVDRIFHLMDTNCDGVVTPDELARWCSRDPALLHSFETFDTVL